jgi:hypothetical protein
MQFFAKEESLLKNPTVLILSSLKDDYRDYEFEISGIRHYSIMPASELKEKQIEFKTDVADDELVLVLIFKDGTHKGFSLARYSMSFLY